MTRGRGPGLRHRAAPCWTCCDVALGAALQGLPATAIPRRPRAVRARAAPWRRCCAAFPDSGPGSVGLSCWVSRSRCWETSPPSTRSPCSCWGPTVADRCEPGSPCRRPPRHHAPASGRQARLGSLACLEILDDKVQGVGGPLLDELLQAFCDHRHHCSNKMGSGAGDGRRQNQGRRAVPSQHVLPPGQQHRAVIACKRSRTRQPHAAGTRSRPSPRPAGVTPCDARMHAPPVVSRYRRTGTSFSEAGWAGSSAAGGVGGSALGSMAAGTAGSGCPAGPSWTAGSTLATSSGAGAASSSPGKSAASSSIGVGGSSAGVSSGLGSAAGSLTVGGGGGGAASASDMLPAGCTRRPEPFQILRSFSVNKSGRQSGQRLSNRIRGPGRNAVADRQIRWGDAAWPRSAAWPRVILGEPGWYNQKAYALPPGAHKHPVYRCACSRCHSHDIYLLIPGTWM